MKKKTGDRVGWKRVIEREYTQAQIQTDAFSGCISLIKIGKIAAPLYAQYSGSPLCVADKGYCWLQHFPSGQRHAMTTMFNADGKIVQWYIDICLANEVDANGVPWFYDLYLDLIVLPTGELIRKDAAELEDAYINGKINDLNYKRAKKEWFRLIGLIESGKFDLLGLSQAHYNLLLAQLDCDGQQESGGH